MKPRYTLDETWEYCLSMYKDISEQEGDIYELKGKWLLEHGFEPIWTNCFFCEYALVDDDGTCSDCPGALVDEKFDCTNAGYHYKHKRKEFYEKLVELQAIRLSGKYSKVESEINNIK